MSKFNKLSLGTQTTNLAGGKSYSISAEVELATILLTSFADDKYYRSNNATTTRIKELIPKCNPKYVAKLIIFTRTQFGMRSITHMMSSIIAPYLSGEPWAKDFYTQVVNRPDDVTEIIAYHTEMGGKLSAAMKKGLAESFNKFNAYTLAKYKGNSKQWGLVDVFNMIHPKPANKKQEQIYKDLMTGNLPSTDTWESELSALGQTIKDKKELEKAKAKVWHTLITENKLGYFALLRNIRNIAQQAHSSTVYLALQALQDENRIKNSLVLPFRFQTAYEALDVLSSDAQRSIKQVLNKAVDIACNNVPKFRGKTVVILDVSGSMTGKPAEIGSLFTAILAKANNADIITFSDKAKYINYDLDTPTIKLAQSFRFAMGGTNFADAIYCMNKQYDRIILLSDMQAWMSDRLMPEYFRQYRIKYDAYPYFYSFDLAGYGTTLKPEPKVLAMAGFSEKVFDVMALLEDNKKSLRSIINDSIEL